MRIKHLAPMSGTESPETIGAAMYRGAQKRSDEVDRNIKYDVSPPHRRQLAKVKWGIGWEGHTNPGLREQTPFPARGTAQDNENVGTGARNPTTG